MTIALCHGTFDIIHPGHVSVFEYAHHLAYRVIITTTADQYIFKGKPLVFNQWERMHLLKAYGEVHIIYSRSGVPAIQRFRPDFFIKGGDYNLEDKVGYLEAEKEEVEKYGGKLILVPHTGHSTTEIIERIRGTR